jgi:DNA polymerase III subunit beta
MKFIAKKDELLEAVKSASSFVSKRAVLPILANVLIEAKGEQIYISGTDLQAAITLIEDARVETEGKITVPARTLLDIVANSTGEITVEMDEKTISICLTDETDGNVVIKGVSAEEYPRLTMPGADALEISSFNLKLLTDYTAFAASSDEARPILTCVNMQSDGDKLTFACADGFRLSAFTLPVPGPEMNVNVSAVQMAKAAGILAGDLKISQNKGDVVIEGANATVSIHGTPGDYPDYNQIFPKEYKTSVKIGSGELGRANSKALVFARDNSNIVKYTFQKITTLFGESAEAGKAEVKVETDIDGDPVEIALNGAFVREIIALTDNYLILEMSDRTSPLVARVDGMTGFIHVLMPMMV